MHCLYCDVVLSTVELRQIDPRTQMPRGCNKCWDSIQDTLKDFNQKDQVDLTEPDELEVTSLDGLEEFSNSKDDTYWRDNDE